MNHRVTTKYVCGVDLHSRNLTAVIEDIEGTILRRATEVACGAEPIMEILAPYGTDITVGVESTYNWYWLVDLLRRWKIPCVLGHALYISHKMSEKHKNDKVDARGIAELLRTNQFPLAYDYPSEMRGVRDLLRRRHTFVRRRAGTMTHFQCCLHQEGYTGPLRNKLQYKSTRDSLINEAVGSDTRKILQSDLTYIQGLDALIDDLEKAVRDRALVHNPKHFEALQTMPGCGEITALTILYEVHTIRRFRTPQQFCSYCRVIRADNSSAGKDYGRLSKDKIGNPDLKWAISEIGMGMLRSCASIQSWHQDQAREHGTAGAHARLRHKIALAVYSILKHDTVFDLERFVGKRYFAQQTPSEPESGLSPESRDVSQANPLTQEDNPPAAAAVNQELESTFKKLGRPRLPRDERGRILHHPATNPDRQASATHQGKETSGPHSKPSLDSAPPAGQLVLKEASAIPPRRGRPRLPRDAQGRIVRPQSQPLTAPQTQQPPPAGSGHDLVQRQLAALTPTDLSALLLSLINIATGAANPSHNWSPHGPDASRSPAALIGAAPVASPKGTNSGNNPT